MIKGIIVVTKDDQKATIKFTKNHCSLNFIHNGYKEPTKSFQQEMINYMSKVSNLH